MAVLPWTCRLRSLSFSLMLLHEEQNHILMYATKYKQIPYINEILMDLFLSQICIHLLFASVYIAKVLPLQ